MRTRRHRLGVIVGTAAMAAAIIGLLSGPAGAITNGTLDTIDVAAGATVMQSFSWPEENGGPTFQVQQCSGVLVSPRVFLTAAHCTDFFRYARNFPQFGITFAGEAPFGAFDPAHDGLLHGQVVQDPEFPTQCPITTCKTSDPHDIAAVILDQAVSITPSQLPAARLLDQLAANNGLRNAAFRVVGYGSVGDAPGGGQPEQNVGRGVRRSATATYMALSPAVLRLSQNAAHGDGGACHGDSGGPVYLGSTDVVVGLTITGDADDGCTATNVAYRLDTDSARAFLASPAIAPYL